MNLKKISEHLLLRIEMLYALRGVVMNVRAGPCMYENAMFWQFEYLYLWDLLDAKKKDGTIFDIGKLVMLCQGFGVEGS